MFQPNDPVSITLVAQEWDQIIALLAEHPYKISAALINKISTQAQRSGPPAPLPNGQIAVPTEH
jgi:hypothetical protein